MCEIYNLNRIIRRHLISAGIRAALFAGLIVLMFTCAFGVMTVEISDMFPAVYPGDIVIYYRLGYIRRDDVVVYGDDKRIGRIYGMKPDIIDVTDDGELTKNGYVQPFQQDKGVFYDTCRINGGARYPLKLTRDKEYFILGDKRDTAKDSRLSGIVSRNEIDGKVFIVIRRRTV